MQTLTKVSRGKSRRRARLQTQTQDSHLSDPQVGFEVLECEVSAGLSPPRSALRLMSSPVKERFLSSLERLGLLEASSSFHRGFQPQNSFHNGVCLRRILPPKMPRPRAPAQAGWLSLLLVPASLGALGACLAIPSKGPGLTIRGLTRPTVHRPSPELRTPRAHINGRLPWTLGEVGSVAPA